MAWLFDSSFNLFAEKGEVIKTKFSFCARLFSLLLVNTKVDLRFHVLSAQWIPVDVRHKIIEKVLLLGFAYTNFCLEQKFFCCCWIA